MIQSRAEVTVRYAETDMMGVVYHGNYLPWFEIGRTTLLKELGLPYRQLEEQGYRLPVLEVALATGFGSASQFARAFARAHGGPPSRHRRAAAPSTQAHK